MAFQEDWFLFMSSYVRADEPSIRENPCGTIFAE
jgi:hypothetical protein